MSETHKKTLTIKVSDSYSITPQQQFETHYKGRFFSILDLTDITVRFWMIYHDNLFLLTQIEKSSEILKELENMENWQSYEKTNTKHTSVGLSGGENKGKTDSTIKEDGILMTSSDDSKKSRQFFASNSGATDSNSRTTDKKEIGEPINEFFSDKFNSVDLSIGINPNVKNQTKNLTLTGDSVDSKSATTQNKENKNVSSADSSTNNYNIGQSDGDNTRKTVNLVARRRDFLYTRIPELRKKFWDKFSPLFY